MIVFRVLGAILAVSVLSLNAAQTDGGAAQTDKGAAQINGENEALQNEASLEDLFYDEGIAAVQKRLQNRILTKDFWQKRLAKYDVKYGYYERPTFVVVVDKTAKSFELLKMQKGITSLIATDAITGLMGDKMVEGDLKTPVGAYEITRQFDPADQYYGPLAFSLSYPNLLDKMAKKTGGGIWIHGFPLNGSRLDEYKTRGCVAINNEILSKMGDLVSGAGGFTLINENGKMSTDASEMAVLMSQILAWKAAWSGDDAAKYLAFYASDFRRFDGMNLSQFKEMKKRIFAKKEVKKIDFSDYAITPYPNIAGERLFRVSFWERYSSDSGYKFEGRKTLYVRLNGGSMQITLEQ